MKFKIILWSVFSLLIFLFACGSKKDIGDIPEVDKVLLDASEPKISTLSNSINDEPENADLYFKRALVYRQYLNFEKALKDVNEAIRLDNGNPGYFILKSQILKESGYKKEALKSARKALDLGSQHPNVFILLATLYSDLGLSKKADEFTEKAILLAPYSAEVVFLDALKELRRGDTLNGLSKLRKSLKIDKSFSESYSKIAEVFYRRNDFDSALVYIVQAMNSSGNKAQVYYLNGKILESSGYKKAGIESFEVAAQKDSLFLPAFEELGDYYYASGSLEKARLNYLNVYQNSSSNRKVNLNLGEIYEKIGQEEKALPFYQSALKLDSSDIEFKNKVVALEEKYRVKPKVSEAIKVEKEKDELEPVSENSHKQETPEIEKTPFPKVENVSPKKDTSTQSKSKKIIKVDTTRPVKQTSKPVKDTVAKKVINPVPETRPNSELEQKKDDIEVIEESEEDKEASRKKKKKNKKASKEEQ